jgi:hypothetical protein
LSRAGKNLAEMGEINRHDKTVTVASKNCDKLFTYTRLLGGRSKFKES